MNITLQKKSKLAARAILAQIVLNRTARNLRSKAKAKERRRHETKAFQPSRFLAKEKFSIPDENLSYFDMDVPEKLDLNDNFEETAEFLRDIRRMAMSERKPLRLVFEHTKHITPASLLLLLAHMHRCRLVFGMNHITGTYPKDNRIERMLHFTGFFKLLGVKSRIKQTKRTYPLEYIEFVSDDRTIQGNAKRLRESLFGETIMMDLHARLQLTRAVNEAMLNAGQHAYPDYSVKSNQESGRWWLVGHVNKRSGKLTILFCDLGVGIANTLPKRYPLEVILAAVALIPGLKPNDAEMIKAGMTIGRTRTREENRGKGLNDLRRFVDEAGNGQLHIYSRKGHYLYEAGGGETLNNSRYSIGGTLIQWTVPLDKVSNWSSTDNDEQDSID